MGLTGRGEAATELELLAAGRLTVGRWERHQGHIYELGRASWRLLSAQPSANIVGATATLLGTLAKRSRGRLATAFVGIEMISISPALAASTTETGVAPISAANAIRLAGPLELAIET